MSTLLSYRSVEGVPGLSAAVIPVYVPTDTLPGLSAPSITLSVSDIESGTSLTGEAKYDEMLTVFRKENVVPLASQAQVLRSLRTKCEEDLPNLDAEILRLHNAIVDLSQKLADVSTKRVRMQNIGSACTSFLSPVRRLPPETLGEIFIHCLPTHGRPVHTEAPLSVTHVCSAWRKAALGLPFLWTSLSIKTNTENWEWYLPVGIMKLWFDRARNHNLKLEIEIYYPTDEYYSHANQSFTDTLIPYTNRLQTLRLTATSINDIHNFATRPPGTVNALESLYLDIPYFGEPDTQITIFQNAPLLRDVILSFVADPLFNLILPWNQLTNIIFFGSIIYQSEMFFVLCECKQLVSGSFVIKPGGDNIHTDHDQCILEYLVDFQLQLSRGRIENQGIFTVFERLTFPALTKLKLTGENTHLSDLSVVVFLQQAQKIQDLTLMSLHGTNNDLLSILTYTPCLSNLRLSLIFQDLGYASLMEALTYKPHEVSRYTYIPTLQRLDLHINLPSQSDREFYFAECEFIAMVRSRQIHAPHVAHLNVDITFPYLRWDRNFLDELFFLRNACANGEVEVHIHSCKRK